MGDDARRRIRTAAGAVLVVAALLLLLRLGAQERGGPAHGDVDLGGGLPATLYLPGDADDGALPPPPPVGQRPPVVLIGHGYSGDRAGTSGIARSLARAGYAVVAFDFRGHGDNPNPFRGLLRDDFATALDWVGTSPWVDGTRVVVLGHSMGAGAAVDVATADPRPVAVVPVSGGWVPNDAVTPSRALLVVAAGDPGRIHDRMDELAASLSARGTVVEQVEVPGADHLTILRSSVAVQRIVGFLDATFGVERDGPPPGLDDPRYGTAGLYLLVALGLLVAIGSVAGRLAPPGAPTEGGPPAWSGLVLVAGALVTTMPFLAAGPIDLLPIGASQPIAVHLALASGVLWAARGLARREGAGGTASSWLGGRAWWPSRASAATGLAAGAALLVLFAPLSGLFHRIVPDLERLAYGAVVAALVLPFFAAFEGLLRRGGPVRAVVVALLGKVVLLAVLVVGLGIGTVPQVVGLVLPLLAGLYLLLEVVGATLYRRSADAAAVAVLDAVVLAWLAVVFSPIA